MHPVAEHVELTDPGLKRSRNEDAILALPEHGVFCVSDGVGGAIGGEVASQAVVDSLTHEFAELPAEPGSQEWEVRVAMLRQAAQGANQWILKRANEWSARGMGATLVGLMLDRHWPEKAMVFHAGDSRAYRWRDGELTCLTRDHTVASLLRGQNGASADAGVGGMLVRAVGAGNGLELEETMLVVVRGDVYLLCSDGLTKMVSERKISALFKKHLAGDLASLATVLVEEAKAAGGSDNVSVVLVRPVFPAADSRDPASSTKVGSLEGESRSLLDKLFSGAKK
jgi:protein phosphatase